MGRLRPGRRDRTPDPPDRAVRGSARDRRAGSHGDGDGRRERGRTCAAAGAPRDRQLQPDGGGALARPHPGANRAAHPRDGGGTAAPAGRRQDQLRRRARAHGRLPAATAGAGDVSDRGGIRPRDGQGRGGGGRPHGAEPGDSGARRPDGRPCTAAGGVGAGRRRSHAGNACPACSRSDSLPRSGGIRRDVHRGGIRRAGQCGERGRPPGATAGAGSRGIDRGRGTGRYGERDTQARRRILRRGP